MVQSYDLTLAMGSDVEIGSAPHPFWHVSPTANGFELWDDREYANGQQDISPIPPK